MSRLRLKVVELVSYFASPHFASPHMAESNFKRAVSCFRDLVNIFFMEMVSLFWAKADLMKFAKTITTGNT
jgi:hypothetical protein